MKERPIIFSAPMVRAILSGTKTQTRRVVKPGGKYRLDLVCPPDGSPSLCPYGQPGDALWVRETYRCTCAHDDDDTICIAYRASQEAARGGIVVENIQRPASIEARAAGDKAWRSSIHMPRWASRITLEITDVRVERLQDISEADAKAEGVSMPDGTPAPPDFWSYQQEFRLVWEQINGGGSWEKNPWVWVIEFKKLEQQA